MDKAKLWAKRILDLVIVLLIIHFMGISSYMLSNSLGIYVPYFGSESLYLTRALQRVIQLVFVILIMRFVFKKPFPQWGFNLKDASVSLKLVLRFLPFFFCIELAYLLFAKYIMASNIGMQYTPKLLNVLIIFAFQGLFTGTSEEPVFRGMVITLLKNSWNMSFKLLNLKIEMTTILSAIIFAVAHMEFSFGPFRILYWNPWQMLTAFLLGVYYAYVFEKTQSLLNPILAHNASNVIIVLLSMLLT
ncbi:MAG: CAAX amino terminal protease self- immunity [Firmicutes bacterium ADurb.Bin356]|nr:MAG: CAAX amino terminal protease self- immunity [Firmicutes bacterium ADurb.Bin356]